MIHNITDSMKDGTKTDIKIGLSGCKLELINNSTIKKTSSKKSFNKRLHKQIEKQLAFSNNVYPYIYTPKIYNVGKNYFDMEYIPGESYNTFFNKCSKDDLDRILNNFEIYFNNTQEYKKIYNSSTLKTKLLNKLDSLYFNSNYKKFIKYIIRTVKNSEYNNIPKTFCHGDLSITNIIFRRNGLYLIDFLDSAIDTFIVDLVKLQQDLRFKWALNAHGSSLRMHQSFNYLWNNLYQKYKMYYNLEFTKIINILNWLRIEPYLKDKKQIKVLNKIITSLEYYEKFNSTHSR